MYSKDAHCLEIFCSLSCPPKSDWQTKRKPQSPLHFFPWKPRARHSLGSAYCSVLLSSELPKRYTFLLSTVLFQKCFHLSNQCLSGDRCPLSTRGEQGERIRKWAHWTLTSGGSWAHVSEVASSPGQLGVSRSHTGHGRLPDVLRESGCREQRELQ